MWWAAQFSFQGHYKKKLGLSFIFATVGTLNEYIRPLTKKMSLEVSLVHINSVKFCPLQSCCTSSSICICISRNQNGSLTAIKLGCRTNTSTSWVTPLLKELLYNFVGSGSKMLACFDDVSKIYWSVITDFAFVSKTAII